MKLQQIRYFMSVYEERSFTAAAQRENATQSGISAHIKQLEYLVGGPLFERGPAGVKPTALGERFYARAVPVLRTLSELERDVASLACELTGSVAVGLMPSLTRAALAPVLDGFARAYPLVDIRVVEAYSAVLTEMVARAELDFAIVPAAPLPERVHGQTLARDREYLVTATCTGRAHLEPVDLATLGSIQLAVPGSANVRRANIERYLSASGAKVERLIELDGMMGTLDLVARSDFMAILPGILLFPDRDGQMRKLHPLVNPPFHLDYVVIEPGIRTLSRPAELFLEALKVEVGRLLDHMNSPSAT